MGERGLLSGVRSILPTSSDLPLTRLVESLMANKEREAGDAERFVYLDPKTGRKTRPPADARPRAPFRDALVFVVGGGCYAEYQNLQDWAKRASASGPRVSVTYGCTELLAPTDLLQQFITLGSKASQRPPALPVD